MKIKSMLETVFEVFAEGGSLVIERQRDSDGEQFLYHHSEFDAGDEGLDVNINGKYDSFEQVFQLINSKYPWFQLHLESVHQDYRTYVTNELIKKLNDQYKTSKALHYSKEVLEKALKIKLKFDFAPIINGLQNISIEFFNGTTTDYEYANLSGDYYEESEHRDVLKIYKTTENLDWKTIKCIGTLHFSGSTVIVKNEYDQPIHIFNSEKALVSTSPILSSTKSWFYQNAF